MLFCVCTNPTLWQISQSHYLHKLISVVDSDWYFLFKTNTNICYAVAATVVHIESFLIDLGKDLEIGLISAFYLHL